MLKKVLIVDDSALMRRLLSDIIEEDEQLTVADTARNGLNAIELLMMGNKYDVVLLDLQMPKMDGVTFLQELKKTKISVPILVVSAIAGETGKDTINALELGAFDFVKKPSRRVGEAYMAFRHELLLRIYCACGLKTDAVEPRPVRQLKPSQREEDTKREKAALHTAAADKEEALRRPPERVVKPAIRKGDRLFVIASSTGGPKALQSVVPVFPLGFPYPIVVVQHMPAGFTASLASRLDELSPLNVKETEDGEVLKKGYIYIAQGGKQCELVQKETGRYVFSVNDKPARGGLKPCADIFFESLVNTSFEEIICGVLTGMGADASKGIQTVKACKKVKVVAQNEETCVVYGMPRAAKQLGVVDDMVPLDKVASMMIRKV